VRVDPWQYLIESHIRVVSAAHLRPSLHGIFSLGMCRKTHAGFYAVSGGKKPE
jgi:hypothetical protein